MSAVPSIPVPASLDIFGPSNALYPFVLPHLPDVLTRIVVHYTCPLYPRQAHYAGNATMHANCHAAFNTDTAHILASTFFSPASRLSSPAARSSSLCRPFSVSGPLTVCGWLYRCRAGGLDCLLSAHSNGSQHGRHSQQLLSIGYAPSGSAGRVQLRARFLDTQLVLPQTSSTAPSWEHIAFTFTPQQQQQQQEEANDDEAAIEDEEDDEEDIADVQPGTTRLYHNGRVAVQSECQPLRLRTTDFHLLLGRHDTKPQTPSMHGGLCDVRLYSRALDEDEVQRLYEGDEGSTDGLEVRWRLDASQRGEEGFVRDSSGHDRHALLPGYPLDISVTGSGGETDEAGDEVQDGDEELVA